MYLLHSKVLGAGKPLLILHGFLGMLDNWKTLGNEFAKHGFEVHLIDQRNHGKSFHSDYFNYELLTEDLYNYIRYYKLKNSNIIGHSMGGKTAMFFATTYPDLVDKLIVADIAPKYYPIYHEIILNGLNVLNFDTLTSRKEADEILSAYVDEMGVRQFLLKNLTRITPQRFGFKFNLPSLSSNIENIGQALPQSSRFTGSVLFLKGDRSNYIQKKDIPEINRHFPQAEIDTISNAGHWLHAENPTAFLTRILSFLQST